jgi:hypothetical protein
MSYKSGEIYFVRETVLNSDSLSPFVKIGLVADKRSSEDRLKEHQTGNPRRLFNQQVIITDSVHRVEAQMHRLYAPFRVSGEWFEFKTEIQVNAAIEKVRELAAEMAKVTPLFISAEELSSVASNGGVLEPTPDILAIVGRWADAKARLTYCDEILSQIKLKLKQAIESGADTKGVAKETTVTFKPKFSESAMKESDEELWKKYVSYTPTWSARFTNSIEMPLFEALSREFRDVVTTLQAQVEEIPVEEAFLLIDTQLELTMVRALAEWDLSLADAELRIAVGEASEIKGICKWGRKPGTPKPVFDESKFAEEHPDLWTKFTLTKDSFTKVSVSKTKQ